MKRVLFVDHVDRVLGGAELNLVELLALARGAEDFEFACACKEGSFLDEALKPLRIRRLNYGLPGELNEFRVAGRGFPWTRALKARKALREAGASLRRVVREYQPSIVVSCTNKDHFASVKACEGTQARTVWWVNDLVTKDFFGWAARVAFRKFAGKADRVVAVSESVRGALQALGIAPAKLRLIPNGIPLEKYRRSERGVLRKALGIPEEEPIFGVIGRFSDWKGQDLFLHVAWRWVTRGRPGHFVLVGRAFNEDQHFEAELKQFVERHSLDARVHFVTFTENINEILTDLDVLLHTSKRPEPFGRVIIEAMAVGTPVIAADAAGPREIIQHGKNGLLARLGDVEDYVTKLREVWPVTAATREWIAAGRRTVEERYTIERVWADWQKLLQEIF